MGSEIEQKAVLPPRSLIAGAWEHGSDGSIVLDPAAAELLLGRRSDGPVELDLEAFSAVIHQDDQPAVARALKDAATGAGSLLVGYRVVRPDGERLVVQRGVFADEGAAVSGAGVLLLVDGPDAGGGDGLLEMAQACIWLKHAAARHDDPGFKQSVLVDMLLIEIGRRLAAPVGIY